MPTSSIHHPKRKSSNRKTGGNGTKDFNEIQREQKCPAPFQYVAIVLERDSLMAFPTKFMYGKMYPPVGIEVPTGECLVLVGKAAASQFSVSNGGFITMAPDNILLIKNQTNLSDRDIGKIIPAPAIGGGKIIPIPKF